MYESNVLLNLIKNGEINEIDKFVEEHLQPVDDALIDARAQELIREGESSYNAYEIAHREYLEERLDALYPSTRQERTSTAVTTVPSDTYNANFPDPMQNTNSMQMRILPDGTRISRVMNPAEAGVSFEQAQSENYEQLKDKRELSRRKKNLNKIWIKRNARMNWMFNTNRHLKKLKTSLVP